MNKRILLSLAVAMHLASAALAQAATPEYVVCKAPSGMAGKGACIHITRVDDKFCADAAGTVCSTSSLRDLCLKAGKAAGIAFDEYASGLGGFKTEESCLAACEQNYGGEFKKFGGECLGVVLGHS